MSEQQFGIGVIGKPHLGGTWSASPLGRYVAGCDLDEAACAQAKEDLGIAVYTDYQEMIAHPEVDVVVVKTPNHVHKAPTIAALEAGKHVFCEKPMALSMEDCREMVETARRHDRMLQVDLELRSSGLPVRMKEIVDSGELGEIRRIMFNHYQGAWDAPPDHWRMNLETSGGIYPEKLVHEVDLFRWLVGEVTAVQSFTTENVLPQSTMPDCLQSMFWFENGALGSMLHTQTRSAMNVEPGHFAECGHELWFDVIGTEGSMCADFWEGCVEVYHFKPGSGPGTRVAHFARFEEFAPLGQHALGHNTGAHFAEFLRRIAAGEPEQQPPEDVLRTMAVTFTAERSVRTGERVTVESP